MDRLLELLRTHSFARKKVFLASGRESDFFIDVKQTALLAEGHARIADAMLHALESFPERAVAVAGVELGGCPLASAVALRSFDRGAPLDAVYVRKEAKDHGSRRLLEGNAHLPAGTRVAVLEDVVTTGGSTLRAVERLREHGLVVVGVVAVVDRREGGAEAIRAAGLPLVALYGREDFLGE
jgi:orotate phosphoribosyltransferase